LALAVAAVFGWQAWGARKVEAGREHSAKDSGAQAETALEFQPAELVSMRQEVLEDVIEFSGPLVAPGTATVRARAGGTLLGWQVQEGSRVRAGQVLGRVDLPDLSNRVAERVAALESARVALAQAERVHAQNENLAAQRFISPAAVDGSRTALEAARAQLAAAEATLATGRASLRDASLVAPIGGIVAKRQVIDGEKLSPEQALMTIVDLATLELAGTVGTHEVPRLSPGLAVEVSVEGLDRMVRGRIARIAPAAEPGTRAIGVTVRLDNPGERLRAGAYALARVRLADAAPRWTLPATALLQVAGEHQVWVLADGRLLRRSVQTGRRDDGRGRVEILGGLTREARVLAMRYDNLREGAAARVALAASVPASGPGR
jgi:RND family efflux transporter MFP subunit